MTLAGVFIAYNAIKYIAKSHAFKYHERALRGLITYF